MKAPARASELANPAWLAPQIDRHSSEIVYKVNNFRHLDVLGGISRSPSHEIH